MNALLFSTGCSAYLKEPLAAAAGLELGTVTRDLFPDAERYLRIGTEVAARDVVLLGATASDADTLELYDLACALSAYGAEALTLVIPYFGYSTMERAAKPGEVVTAKTRARLLSSIPPARGGNRVVLLDLHTEGLPHYFEAGLVPFHVSAWPALMEDARRLGGTEGFVIGCTDAGRAKVVQRMANELGVDAAFVFKRRYDGGSTEVTAVSAQVEGLPVVLYDDMVRSGGSLVRAAEAYRAAGASRVAAIATHGVLPEGSLEKIRALVGVLDELVVTDSHPRAAELAGDFLTVRSVAGVLGAELARSLR